MNTIAFSPFYRNGAGLNRMVSLLDNVLGAEPAVAGYPACNIERLGSDHYAITLAVPGYQRDRLDVAVEGGLLTVTGKNSSDEGRNFLYKGIADRPFERRFELAEHVEVTGAEFDSGLLRISLARVVPEALKRRSIAIRDGGDTVEGQLESDQGDSTTDAA